MKEILRDNVINLPYSLHDAHINRIHLKDDIVRMDFNHGFYCPFEGDTVPIAGSIELRQVDLDFCNVYIMDMPGKDGSFKGREISLEDYARNSGNVDMEIVDETYGYNKSKFSGYMYNGEEIKGFVIEVYHFGPMVYVMEG